MNETPLTLKQHMLVRRAMHVTEDEAAKLKSKYGNLVDADDLASEGKLALYDCVRRFDDQLGTPLDVYARLRVRGAMLKRVKCETREARIKREMRIASAESVADYHDDYDILRDTRDEFQRRIDLLCERHAAAMFLAGAERARHEADTDPEAAREYAHAIATLAEVVEPLGDDDRRLLDLVYASRFNLDQAAEELQIVKKTAWRRLHRVLDRLRLALVALEVTRAPPRAHVAHLRPVLTDHGPPTHRKREGPSSIEADDGPSENPQQQR